MLSCVSRLVALPAQGPAFSVLRCQRGNGDATTSIVTFLKHRKALFQTWKSPARMLPGKRCPCMLLRFIQQALEWRSTYERAIYLSKGVLRLDAAQIEAEKRRAAAELSAAESCMEERTLVEQNIEGFRQRILSQVFTDNDAVNEIAKYVLTSQSKLFRPRLGLMIARVISVCSYAGAQGVTTPTPDGWPESPIAPAESSDDVMERVLRLLQSYEIVHAGSLIHDDILDDAETRRRLQSVHLKVGTKLAVLVGDLMLTRACCTVANLGSQQPTVRMAKALENLIKGELMQVKPSNSVDDMMHVYLNKIFLKTASLIAECSASIANLFRLDAIDCHKWYLIGLHVGMAFQIYDDMLDYSRGNVDLGKPTLKDLSSGLITMPLLMALPDSRELASLIADDAIHEGNLDAVLSAVRNGQAFERSHCAMMLHLLEASNLLRAIDVSGTAPGSALSAPIQNLLCFVHDTLTRSKE
ncbi:polyprenyl synthetase superfamily protein, putative [Babesia bigemina]|uniref:Polyprenyl synthetase superfamily protein, putative n=1 Tax=Babesia bigemina TaxID=5866 RepID=A0A061DC44_BABBI|nr:polyprenyl synthetase superfamily protein, putative [Babesia bigemina]CDR97592.1 polyprenyl synthetase superfamily protein, putative [Babesia bigemina]|eukprot:XP_012769778.1 polyprenyl synthetase superfamily protein, putative [Babesia bigemina]